MLLLPSTLNHLSIIMLNVIWLVMFYEIPTVAATSENMLFIRHGRSRVRHSNEKDHIRWGLQAFDNLTLDYDIDGLENDTITNVTNPNSGSILFGSDLWAMSDNLSYFSNQTLQIYSTQKSRAYSVPTSGEDSPSAVASTTSTTSFSVNYNPPRKKLRKKKIMENIKKTVDKGLEYLKLHQDLDEDNIKMFSPTILSVSQPEFGYQNDGQQFNMDRNIEQPYEPKKLELDEKSVNFRSPNDLKIAEGVTIRADRNSDEQQSNTNVVGGDTDSGPHKNDNELVMNLSNIHHDGDGGGGGDDDDVAVPPVVDHSEPSHSASTSVGGMGLGTLNDDSESGIFDENRDDAGMDTDETNNNNNNNNDDDIIEDELILANIFDGMTEEDLSELDEISRNNRLNLMKGRDVVTKFLQIVETQHLLGANCKAGTALNLGEGVVDRYAQDRFRVEAEVAVNRANMLTSIFKSTAPAVQSSEHLLHASVLSMVAFDDDIFAAGHCFDWDQHPSKSGLFCPFAYRLPSPDQGASFAKDLAAEYDYLGNTSEWFFQARKNAERVIARNDQYIKAFHLYLNRTDREEDEFLAVKYEDGRWSKPYYDCGGGNIWMLTYTVPFFGYDHDNSTYFFKGTSGIDIDLRRVDIDQCPQRNTPGTTQPLNIFAGTDKCKQRTTMCAPIPGLGFRRGSYKCVCRKGFYFPDTTAPQKYINGSVLEEEYEKLMLAENSSYNKPLTYECLPCAEGCDYCEDASPCVAALNWPMRTSILVLACAVIGFLPPAAWFTFRYQQVKVVRAASPALLRVIALGAFFIYCTTIVMYPHPSLYTCTARIWLREIGFSLTYGALMLKTWRISVIFRVRSAKAVKITDAALLKRLGVICGVIGACLLVRTIVSPPEVVVGRTADDLKAFLCRTDYWDYTFTSMEVLFLAWGVRLCIMVRKAPSEFNESRFISMAIYNEFLLTCFLNVSMLFLQSPANPDLLFIIFFCHTQLTVTLLLGLIFGSKVYIVLRSGKSQEAIAMGAKSSGAKFNFRPQIRTFANPSTSTSTAQMHTADTKLSDQEALEEIRQLSVQLQRIQESAPPKGIAVMTISSLLDGLKMTTHQLSLKPPSGLVGGSGGSGSSGLALFAINNDLQKLSQNNNSNLQPPVHHPPVNSVEKSINTSLTGEEFLRKIETSSNICRNCSTVLLKSCQQLAESPNISRNNVSFSNLQLDCMCSTQPDDDLSLDHQNNVQLILGLPGTDKLYQNNHSNGSSNHIISKSVNGRELVSIGCSTVLPPKLSHSRPTSIRSRKPKFHSSSNLMQLHKELNQHLHQHQAATSGNLRYSENASTTATKNSSCDNHKSNENFLICDNCKKNSTINTINTESGAPKSNQLTTNIDSNRKHRTNRHEDDGDDDNHDHDISFHSTDDSSCCYDDKQGVSDSTVVAVTVSRTGGDYDGGTAEIGADVQSERLNDDGSTKTTSSSSSSASSNTGSGTNIAETDCGGGTTADALTTSSDGRKKRHHRKRDKLVLDLNDRSKYTKEVSV